MAICRMSKIKLLGLINNREEIMQTLFSCGSVELTEVESVDNMLPQSEKCDFSVTLNNFDRAKRTIEFVSNCIDKIKDKESFKDKDLSILKNFFVSYKEFTSILDEEDDVLRYISEFEKDEKEINDYNSEINKLNNLSSQLTPYLLDKNKFSDYISTDYVKCFYGLIKQDNLELLQNSLKNLEYVSLEVVSLGDLSIICVYAHKNYEVDVNEKLNELGFNRCPFDFEMTAKEKLSEINSQILLNLTKIENTYLDVLNRLYKLREIKILCDYYKLLIEKNQDENEFLYTEKTFLLQGYVPNDCIDNLKEKLLNITDAIYIDILEPTKDDVPPTLVKNRPLVRQTEFVTDLYSTPNYREMDPSKVIFFFFMLFMGIIMADVGYGVCMVIIGLILARKIKVDNGTRRLWYIVTMGGVSTIIFGLLFNSFFGASVFSSSILPNPVPSADNGGDMTSLMVVLLGCLGIGVIQIAVGYACKAINLFMQGDILGAFFEGIDWVIFFVGLVFAGMPLLFDMLLPNGINSVMSENTANFFKMMQTPGLIILIVTIVIAALTAGRNERGFGKFTKGFGAVYGLINLMSDILSYARLFGLMLSGMIIAQTFNDLGTGVMASGGVMYIFGGLIIVVGHVFNIAMNVLGAYIHDSRLQYIEFFGKFYTGEGRKFVPFGSQMDYIYLTK